jgi:hypothetical protein
MTKKENRKANKLEKEKKKKNAYPQFKYDVAIYIRFIISPS